MKGDGTIGGRMGDRRSVNGDCDDRQLVTARALLPCNTQSDRQRQRSNIAGLTESRSFHRWHPARQQSLDAGQEATLAEAHRDPAANDGDVAVAGQQGGQGAQDGADEYSQGQQLLGAVGTGHVTARHLRHHVAPEERAQDEAAHLRVPVVLLDRNRLLALRHLSVAPSSSNLPPPSLSL
jgi:hypothetical protein